MGHGKQIRGLREPGSLIEMYQFVNQAGAIVDPTSNRSDGVQEEIGLLRVAYLDAKKAVDDGADEEQTIKTEYRKLLNTLAD